MLEGHGARTGPSRGVPAAAQDARQREEMQLRKLFSPSVTPAAFKGAAGVHGCG